MFITELGWCGHALPPRIMPQQFSQTLSQDDHLSNGLAHLIRETVAICLVFISITASSLLDGIIYPE